MTRLPDHTDLTEARRRLDGVAVRTPLLEAPQISELAGRRVLVKAECLQRTGSFKFRGAWNRVSALSGDEKRKGVVAFSSGNHAQGVALSGQLTDTPVVIVMPRDAPAAKVDATRDYGAEVILYDRETQDRNAIAADLSASRGLTLIPPFDDPYVIAGQGTCGLEIAEQAGALGIETAEMLVCCSGGGFTSGIALALEQDAPGFRVRPVEPVGFDDFTRSLATGTRQRNAAPGGSIQDALLTPTPGLLTWAVGQRLFGPGLTVSDDETLQTIALAWRWLKIVLEPGGAAALAAALFRQDALTAETVIVTASGGNVDRALFERALATRA